MRAILLILVLVMGCAHYQRDPWTKTDLALALASTVAAAADAYTTTRFLNNSHNYEMNPAMGQRPTDTQVIATMAAFQAVVLGASYFMPKEWRRILLGSKTIANTTLTIHNTTLEW